MFCGILIFDPKRPFCKGYSLCVIGNFQNRLVSGVVGFVVDRSVGQI